MPKNYWKWWSPTIIGKTIHSIQLKLGVPCTIIWWVFRNDWIWDRVGLILACWWPKKTKNCGFWLLSAKIITQSTSVLVYTLLGWMDRTDSLLGHSSGPKMTENGSFQSLSAKLPCNHLIHFNLGVYSYLVCLQKSILGHVGANLAHR